MGRGGDVYCSNPSPGLPFTYVQKPTLNKPIFDIWNTCLCTSRIYLLISWYFNYKSGLNMFLTCYISLTKEIWIKSTSCIISELFPVNHWSYLDKIVLKFERFLMKTRIESAPFLMDEYNFFHWLLMKHHDISRQWKHSSESFRRRGSAVTTLGPTDC